MSNEALRLADAARIAELEQELDRLQGNYLIAFERGRIAGIAELEKEALAKPFAPDWAGYRQGLEDGKREGQAERDRLLKTVADDTTLVFDLCAERDQLRAEVERLRPDALRYHAFFASGLSVCFEGVEHYTKADCDAAIDAALTHKETP